MVSMGFHSPRGIVDMALFKNANMILSLIEGTQMLAGEYTLEINCPENGLETSRTFSVVNSQVTDTVTSQMTATGSANYVATVTVFSTSIEIDTSVAPASTVTEAGITAGKVTIHP